ncbi:hypothetical protein QNN00_12910 [Bacillus velezensis]|nr:hypothetical protein [Bacillus velezensis]
MDETKKFAKLLELWVKGLKVEWSELYNGDLPHRISLPGYPFIKDRYWPDDARRTMFVMLNHILKHFVKSAFYRKAGQKATVFRLRKCGASSE